ncbi:uncharacterized protein PEZ65_019361 [Lycodopsis pacificus]
MSKVEMLRSLVNQRLTAAAEEIFGLFERTIAEHEEELCRSKEENERQRKLLDAVFNSGVRKQSAHVQQLLVVEEVPPEQQEWSSILDQEDPEPPHLKEQEDPEPPHVKEEQEDLCISQEGEQLQGLEEADVKYSFTPVKSEDDEEEAQSSQLYQRQTEQMETEEDCGGPEPDRNLYPDRYPEPDTDDKTGDFSDTDDSADWKETREPQSGLNSLKLLVSDSRCSAGEKPFRCSECEKTFGQSRYLTRHMKIHTGEKQYSCSVCTKDFYSRSNLKTHMNIHTGEKPYSCSVCKKSFNQCSNLKTHMKIHTGERPYSCSVCKKSFGLKLACQDHKRTHTGERPFSCSVCDKTFMRKANLKVHVKTHTGKNPL